MKEKSKGKGKGWREPTDPTCIGKDGKTKARKHHEVALKKEAGEANNTPMERKAADEIPILSLPKGERKEEKTTLDIACPTNKEEWLEKVAEANGFKVSFERNLAHIELPTGLLDAVLELTDGFEAEFEEEMREAVVVFRHKKPIPDALLGKFCKEFNTELNEDENRQKISTKRKDAGSLQEFMSEHGIELEEIEDREMEEAHHSTAEQVVAEVQSRRKESAKARDNSKTAKNVGEKEDASALVDWVKNPAKSDLEGVDTKE